MQCEENSANPGITASLLPIKFNQVIWYSVIINIITFFVELFIAIPLGILAARKQI